MCNCWSRNTNSMAGGTSPGRYGVVCAGIGLVGDGKAEEDVLEFVETVNREAVAGNWPENQKLQLAKGALREIASEWRWLHDAEAPRDWEGWSAALCAAFRKRYTFGEWEKMVTAKVQQTNETGPQYALAKTKLRRHCPYPMTEADFESFGKRQSPAVSALEVPTNRPIIDVTIPGIGIVKAMVDSGANTSVIRHSVVASIKHLIIPVSSILKMADGRSVETIGELDLKITVLVLMELSHDLILGTDWINLIGGISILGANGSLKLCQICVV
ncbi:hypothetical protein GHT06_009215 [Daphnia sinensis]|uniref:Uncharacterized protein n=1 Tax=Daphnia sinensis TaxID=1820382 RepID=A0AAD5Q1A6_9CRUS|nr:hypothetical protein GHT06_009215 [Daphnia sinensis]